MAPRVLHCRTILFGSLALALASSACGSDGKTDAASENPDSENPDPGEPDPGESDDCDDVVVAESDCDTSLRPIVFIHGTFGSATEISNTAQLFGSNGYCEDRFVAVEYDSLGGSPVAQLADLVDQVLADTGMDQVDLAAHSQGTAHACTFLGDPDQAAKVAHYLNISGGCDGVGVPTLSLSSENDLRGGPVHSSGDNVEQVTLVDEDHVALAGSKNAFVAMYRYLRMEDPQYTTVQCGEETITIDGKSVTFGDNVPRPGSTIDVFEIDELTDSPWERGEPSLTIVADEDGHINMQLERNVQYEFRVSDADGSLSGYGYNSFRRSSYLMRFLSPSLNPLVSSMTTDRIVRSPNHVAIVARYVAGAFREDWNNSLKIDGVEVLSDENAARDASVVGLFIYDANENGESDFGSVFNTSFVRGTDMFLDASTPRWMEVEWTNEEQESAALKVPNWPSSEAVVRLNFPFP